jgi:alcohol dehydrogenase class IV
MKAVLNLPTEVYSGSGVYRNIGKLTGDNGKLLIVTDEGLAATPVPGMITAILEAEEINFETYTDINPNPDEETVLKITEYIKSNNIDRIIALGGGSPLDAAKAAAALAANPGSLEDYQWNGLAFENPAIPLIAIPTTAGTGSEVTGVSVITSRNMKKGVLGKAIFPKSALIDPQLMTGLPPFLTAVTGLDALTHAIESYIGLNSNPLTDSLAMEAIRLIHENLLKAYRNGDNLEAREKMAMASTMAGIAMDQAGLGIVHSLSGPVCSYLHLSHGFANALLLSFGMKYNLQTSSTKLAKIAVLLEADTRGMDEKTAALAAIDEVKKLVSTLDLDEKIKKVQNQKVDTVIFGDNASRMFLIKNNPRKAGAEDCQEIFDEIFTA